MVRRARRSRHTLWHVGQVGHGKKIWQVGQTRLARHSEDCYISFEKFQFCWSHSFTWKFIHLLTVSKVDHVIKRSALLLSTFFENIFIQTYLGQSLE